MQAALELGVPGNRITAVAAHDPDLAHKIIITGSLQSAADSSMRLASLIADGSLNIPIAATYPITDIASAAAALLERHTHGKIVVTL